MSHPALETPRLLLRPLELGDAVQVQPLFGTWAVVRYLAATVPWPFPPDGAHAFYRDVLLPMVERGEAFAWTLRLKEAPERIIGSIALHRRPEENRGYWLAEPWHGRGLMSEACEAATAFWFDVLGERVLRTSKVAENVPSRRISERQGARVVATGERDAVCGRVRFETWELSAETWRRRREERAGEAAEAAPAPE
jgi:RimJ/RimL family protein N-acetyltransferase